MKIYCQKRRLKNFFSKLIRYSVFAQGASQFLKGANRRQYRRLPRLPGETMGGKKAAKKSSKKAGLEADAI